jgi:hypothetical protein
MAYMDQEQKAKIAQALKIALKDSGLKYSLAVRDHSTLIMTVTKGPIDFAAAQVPTEYTRDYIDVNQYHFETQFYDGKAKDMIRTILSCLNMGNWDKSDYQSDYFNVGWYISLKIGTYGKPYEVTGV